MNNDQLPTPTINPDPQVTQIPQNVQSVKNAQNPQTPPQPEKTHKKLLATIIIITIIIVATAVVLIAAVTHQRATTTSDNEEKPQKEQKTEGVVGYDPGHPLEDNKDLDVDRSAEYHDSLKVFIELNEPLQYSDLQQKVASISSKCKVSLLSKPPIDDVEIPERIGEILCDDAGVIRFNYKKEGNKEIVSGYNYSEAFAIENVVFIRDLGDGRYEFGNDALSGIYSNKNRAINAYLYYLDLRKEYTKNQ